MRRADAIALESTARHVRRLQDWRRRHRAQGPLHLMCYLHHLEFIDRLTEPTPAYAETAARRAMPGITGRPHCIKRAFSG
jgi:hypothetical protein